MEYKEIVNKKIFSLPESFAKRKFIQDKSVELQTDSRIPSYRGIFDRDRDRILYSRIFRRQNGKTQIFMPNTNDYIRTRLTHSLEVNQIAKSIGKGLGLNLSLIEAIALGHDVGHTPFGHAGEDELNRIMNNCYSERYPVELGKNERGFKHNFQAVRAMCELEKHYQNKGLNLSPFTLWGVLNHTKTETKKCPYSQTTHVLLEISININEAQEILTLFAETRGGIKNIEFSHSWEAIVEFDHKVISSQDFEKRFTGEDGIQFKESINTCFYRYSSSLCPTKGEFSLDYYTNIVEKNISYSNHKPAWSFEALVVSIADEIAQIHHDIEDSLYMGTVSLYEAKRLIREGFSGTINQIRNKKTKDNFIKLLNTTSNALDSAIFMSYAEKTVLDLMISGYIEKGLREFQQIRTEFNIRTNTDFTKNHQNIYDKYFKGLFDITENKIIRLDEHGLIKEYKQKFYNSVINSEEVQKLNNLGENVINDLFIAFVSNPKLLPNETLRKFEEISENAESIMNNTDFLNETTHEGYSEKIKMGIGHIRNNMGELFNDENIKKNIMRIICDHISGMTDNYALKKHHEIYGTDYGI